MGLLDGKVALVTGGGSGIGRSVVQRFIQEGAQVGVLERVAQRVDELKSDFGPSLIAVCGDVSRTQDNEAVVEQTVSAFGGLDIFVGNAGVFDMFTLLADIPKDKLGEAFDEQFSINVKGLLLGAKASVDALGKTGGCMDYLEIIHDATGAEGKGAKLAFHLADNRTMPVRQYWLIALYPI